MKHLFIFLFILCMHKSQAQYYGEDSVSQARNQIIFKSDYWENFGLGKSGRHSIVLGANPINIPVNSYREVFQVRRDSLLNIEIKEEGESEKIMFAGYKVSCSYSYTWPSAKPDRHNEIRSEARMTFFFWHHDYEEFIDSMIFELYKNDSLRCVLHKRLRAKHETYLKRRMGISINIKELLSRVEHIKVYNREDFTAKPHGYKCPIETIIYKDDTIITNNKFKKSIKGKEKTELLELLSDNGEWMTTFNYMAFVDDYTLLLSDKENNFIGEIRITGPISGGNGFKCYLKVMEGYFYSTTALSYKGFDRIRALVVK